MRMGSRLGSSLAALCLCVSVRGADDAPAPFTIRPKEIVQAAGGYALPEDLQIRSTTKAKEKLWVFAEKLEGTRFNLRIVPIKLTGLEAVAMGELKTQVNLPIILCFCVSSSRLPQILPLANLASSDIIRS